MRFSPSPWQLLALDAVAGAGGVTLAMLLRFIDEGSLPATYAQRLVPWLVLAAAIQIGVGEVMNRLRKPGSALARRPVAPFLVATALSLVVVLTINDVVLREPWRLPHLVAIIGPLLAAVGSAALRMAAARSIDVDDVASFAALYPIKLEALGLFSKNPDRIGRRRQWEKRLASVDVTGGRENAANTCRSSPGEPAKPAAKRHKTSAIPRYGLGATQALARHGL